MSPPVRERPNHLMSTAHTAHSIATTTMPAMSISCHKSFKYTKYPLARGPKTDRTELSGIARAFAVGALTALRGDHASQHQLARTMGRSQGTLSELLKRVEQKANDKTVAPWDEILYQNDLGRGRSKLLSKKQRQQIIEIVTSSRNNHEKEAWQAIADGDFSEIVPEMSISTFENVLYKVGYARRSPGWKPSLTPDQEKERKAWVIEHDPDDEHYGDLKGYDFHQVVFTDETPARIGEERDMIRTW